MTLQSVCAGSPSYSNRSTERYKWFSEREEDATDLIVVIPQF